MRNCLEVESARTVAPAAKDPTSCGAVFGLQRPLLHPVHDSRRHFCLSCKGNKTLTGDFGCQGIPPWSVEGSGSQKVSE